ncbi:hypothetical protein M426DRAFT_266967, partial [Hypoxylon sp. CI-4A]
MAYRLLQDTPIFLRLPDSFELPDFSSTGSRTPHPDRCVKSEDGVRLDLLRRGLVNGIKRAAWANGVDWLLPSKLKTPAPGREAPFGHRAEVFVFDAENRRQEPVSLRAPGAGVDASACVDAGVVTGTVDGVVTECAVAGATFVAYRSVVAIGSDRGRSGVKPRITRVSSSVFGAGVSSAVSAIRFRWARSHMASIERCQSLSRAASRPTVESSREARWL